MFKFSLKKIKEKLEAEKKILEQELQKFAEKDKNLPHDWDTRFPKFNGGAGSQAMEDEAGEVEEYVTRLPIEYSLETRLRDINLALEKIEKGEYGKCEKCGKNIPKERLEVCPEARFCLKCTKK
jgi:RNA polymerase-binding transcription factor DksA